MGIVYKIRQKSTGKWMGNGNRPWFVRGEGRTWPSRAALMQSIEGHWLGSCPCVREDEWDDIEVVCVETIERSVEPIADVVSEQKARREELDRQRDERYQRRRIAEARRLLKEAGHDV